MEKRYILLTAAKNEADYIGAAIESVVCQSVQPSAWFIMDDGSTDRTASIVEAFSKTHPFIRLLSAGVREGRNFGAQYRAIQSSYAVAKSLQFDFVGVHDADIAPVRCDYYGSILSEFERNPRLGIAGGFIHERLNGEWQCRPSNSIDSVAGGVQMFRRDCFERIGGYTPLQLGGSDWLAQISARMAGYEILAKADAPVLHYRPTSTAGGKWRGIYRMGLMDASFGSHPLFEFFKCCRRAKNRPFLVGSAVRYGGFLYWGLTGRKPLIKAEEVAFLRREQTAKLRRWLWPFERRSAPALRTS